MWFVPKALISHKSPFFRAAFEQSFKEKAENKITLPEDESDVFRLFFQWLYYKEFAINNISTPTPIHPYVKAWVFGDKIGATEFRDYCMTQFFAAYTPECGSVTVIGAQFKRYKITASVSHMMYSNPYHVPSLPLLPQRTRTTLGTSAQKCRRQRNRQERRVGQSLGPISGIQARSVLPFHLHI